MSGYRLEWRSPADADLSDFGLCAVFGDAVTLKRAVLELAADGAAADDEFHVVKIAPDGSVVFRVLTDASAIADWPASGDTGPAGSGASSRWAADMERTDAAMVAAEAVRTSVERAYRAGSLSAEAASRLMEEARRALDDE